MSGLQYVWTVTLTLCLLTSIGWSALVLAATATLAHLVPARGRHAIWWTALMLCVLPVAGGLLILSVPFGNGLPTAPGSAVAMLADSGKSAARVSGPVFWNWLGAVSPLVTAAYGAGLVWHTGVLARGQMRLTRLLADCGPVSYPRLEQSLQRWRVRLGLGNLPRLQSTSIEISPFLSGWRRPVLVLPASLLQQHEYDTAILVCAHELVHLRRGDNRLLPVQRVLSVLVWFNPFAWSIIRRLNASREAACDAMVLDHASHQRRAYAHALLKVLRLASGEPVRTAALGVSLIQSGRKEHEMRMKAILTHRHAASTPGRTLMCCTVLLAALGPLGAIQVAVAKGTALSASAGLSSPGPTSASNELAPQGPAFAEAGTLAACKDAPLLISRVSPDYPVPGAEAEVILEFTITTDGRTGDIEVVKSTDSRFNKAAAEAVKKWRYAPCGDDTPRERKGVRVMIQFKQKMPVK